MLCGRYNMCPDDVHGQARPQRASQGRTSPTLHGQAQLVSRPTCFDCSGLDVNNGSSQQSRYRVILSDRKGANWDSKGRTRRVSDSWAECTGNTSPLLSYSC